MTLPQNQISAANESVESGVTGWTASTNVTSLASSTAHAVDGTHSMLVTCTAAGDSLAYTDGGTVTPGKCYTAAYWVYTTLTGRTAKVEVDFFDSTGATYVTELDTDQLGWTPTTLIPNQWNWVNLLMQVPTGTTPAIGTATFVIDMVATAASDTFYVDEAYFGPPWLPPVVARTVGPAPLIRAALF